MKEVTEEEAPAAVEVQEQVKNQEEEDGDETKEEEEEQGRGKKRGRRGGGGARELQVMVKRELLAACMTCHICNRLLRDATTISECLHTCESPSSPSLLPPRFASLRHTSLPRSRLIWPPRTAPPGRGIRRASRPRCRRRGSLTWAVPRSTALTLEFSSI
jgi:hypothetical protein